MWRLLWKHKERKSDSQRTHFLGKKDRACQLKCPGRILTQADCKGKENNSAILCDFTETSAVKAIMTSTTVGHPIPHASADILRKFHPSK